MTRNHLGNANLMHLAPGGIFALCGLGMLAGTIGFGPAAAAALAAATFCLAGHAGFRTLNLDDRHLVATTIGLVVAVGFAALWTISGIQGVGLGMIAAAGLGSLFATTRLLDGWNSRLRDAAVVAVPTALTIAMIAAYLALVR